MTSRRSFLTGVAASTGAILTGAEPPAPVRRIRLGFLGAAYSHFQGKYDVALRSPDFEVIGVCEENPEVRQRRSPSLRWMSFPDLAPSCEALVIESEVRRHAPDALRALEAGKHVHIEKPPASSMAAFEDILNLAAQHRRVIQVGYMWRYNPGLNALLEAGRDGTFGEIFSVRATMNTLADAESRRDWAEFPGGAMFEQGCHLTDAVVRLLGRPDRVTPYLQELGRPADALADNTVAILEYPRCLAVISSAPRQPHANPHRFLEITGTRGTGRLQPVEPPRLVLETVPTGGNNEPVRSEPRFPEYRRYVDDFTAFAAAIRGERPLAVPPATERLVHETVLRACGMV
ncbi:MAG: Gfo/Idh/MocA family oxidoreductase [Verrucomicrobiales bacterium]|nr:Gfo/Idh/MocA family oxidoreductase [Verrucomicrobiales bacterium]